jgi:uncharacterized membrane protein
LRTAWSLAEEIGASGFCIKSRQGCVHGYICRWLCMEKTDFARNTNYKIRFFFLHILWLTICFFSSGIFCILIFSVGSRPWLFPRVASLYKSLKGQI